MDLSKDVLWKHENVMIYASSVRFSREVFDSGDEACGIAEI